MEVLIVGIISAIVPTVGSVVVAQIKVKADARTVAGDRLKDMEDRIDDLNRRIDEEVRTRRAAETQAWRAQSALRRAIDYLIAFRDWIEAGAKPPPPIMPDLDELHAALPEK